MMNQAPITLSFLPLQHLAEDPRIEMFCAGLRMDIITDLSRFRSFQIIPAESQDSLPVDLDYLVKGITRFYEGRLQINLQLIQVRENRLVWAEKFGDTLEHIFQIEGEIIQKIVVSLQQFVDHDLLTQIRKRPQTDLSAYESWLYGMEALKTGTVEADETARDFFQDALEKDPGFARAYTGMSLTYFNEWSCLHWDKWEETQQHAIEWALKAVELDTWDPQNALILGKCYLFYKQYNKAEYHLRKALELNPANPRHLAGIAFCLVYLGYREEAMELYKKAVRLDPSRRGFMMTGTLIHFENGLYQEAIEMGERCLGGTEEWIDFHAMLAAAYYHLGDWENMWAYWREYVAYFQRKIQPDQEENEAQAWQWTVEVNPYQRYTHHQAFWDYIREQLGSDLVSQPPQSPEPATSFEPVSNQLLKEGTIWRLSYGGKTTQLTELKGLHDIARLLETPRVSVHCADLMGLTILESGAPVLDQQAKRSYEKRLLEIQESLAEAEQFQHHGEIERLQTEYDDLLTHLSQSVGMGGKTRKASGSLEKARSAVTWRIRSAIKKIEAVHPAMARHLKSSIKTGLFCTYQPEHDLVWEL